jgi:hypothetical protein
MQLRCDFDVIGKMKFELKRKSKQLIRKKS